MATRYWVGGGSSTNWNATGNTNWAATSGGANNASVPGTGDTVVFDSNSGSGTAVVNTGFTIQGADFNGFVGTLSGASAIAINTSGATAFRLSSGMTLAWTGALSFSHTSGTATLTSAGKTLNSVTIDCPGGTVSVADAFTTSAAGSVTHNQGNLTFANVAVTIGVSFTVSPNSNTRTLTMGGGLWTVGNSVQGSTGTSNYTVVTNGSTIVINGTGTHNLGIIGATLPKITVALGATLGPPSPLSLVGGTIAELDILAAYMRIGCTVATTVTLFHDITGNAHAISFMNSIGLSAAVTISGTMLIENAYIAEFTFAGGTVNVDNCLIPAGTTVTGVTDITETIAEQVWGANPAFGAMVTGTVATGAVGAVTPSAVSIAPDVADQFKHRKLIFTHDTPTLGLRGAVSAITASSDAALPALTLSPALPAAPAAGDTFVIV